MSVELPLEVLACPACRAALARRNGVLACGGCSATYAIRDGVADLVAPEFRARAADLRDHSWDRWRDAMRGLDAWRSRFVPGGSRAGRDGETAGDAAIRALFSTANVRGVVLDVGAGDGAWRKLLPRECQYIGVDPVVDAAGLARSGSLVVRGVGEALPVRDRSVDAVISLESFDCLGDASAVIEEMYRVLKPGGTLAMSIRVVSSTVARARASRTRQARLASAFQAVREVGLRAGAGLVGAAAFERERPQTPYYTRGQCTALLSRKFDLGAVEESPQGAMTLLYVHGTKKRMTRLPVFREGR